MANNSNDQNRGGSGNFANDRERASDAGKKGGQASHGGEHRGSGGQSDDKRGGGGNVANERDHGSDAGKKGGQSSGGSQGGRS